MNSVQATTIDLVGLELPPGGGRRIEREVGVAPIELGAQRYRVAGDAVAARLEVSRSSAGWAMRLRFDAPMSGPCIRCLSEAEAVVTVDVREVEHPAATDEELRSPYVSEDELDLGAWARDALVLAMPDKYLCREDCAGLCPVCGASLNDADPEEHRHARAPDPRWDRLRELKTD